ncbi:MAG TPA: PHP domain-containing protein [Bellilinea sp.]|nr:PHP domain-containing protein [Bellilinea sp.]
MLTLRAEFHVHTVLSPCAELEMLPPLIVMEALERGIHLIAITDHNATGNIRAVQKAAAGTGLTVLPGMELQTREEVHVLCLFDQPEQAEKWQEVVSSCLPKMENRPGFFGDQLLVDEIGEFVARESRLLLTSTSLSIDEVCQQVEGLGGMVIPAHVNRPANGLISMLGFVPPEIPFSALEISRHLKPSAAVALHPQLAGYPLIQGGDAHRLEDLRGVNQLLVEAPTLAEIKLAFKKSGGRSARILSTSTL